MNLEAQRERYGEHLFERDGEGFYTCFFEGCGQTLKGGNFARHVGRHEEQGDRVDAEHDHERKQAFITTRLLAMREERAARVAQGLPPPAAVVRDSGPKRSCVHEEHDVLFPDVPRLQSVDSFYSHSSKCKKCYIHLQSERMRRQRHGDKATPAPPKRMRPMPSADVVPGPVHGTPVAAEDAAAAGPDPPRGAVYALAPRAALEDARADALLGLAHVDGSAPPEPRVGLRHAAHAACWARAILGEAREHSYGALAKAELDGLDVDVEQGSLGQLEEALVRALDGAMHRWGPSLEAAQLQALAVHVRRRVQSAQQALRVIGAPGGVCGGCQRSTDPSPDSGSPCLCTGYCGRVFHAACAGTPDESGWVCEDCTQRSLYVVHWDGERRDWYHLESPLPPQWDARGPFTPSTGPLPDGRTLGRLVRAARRSDSLLAGLAQREAEGRAADDE